MLESKTDRRGFFLAFLGLCGGIAGGLWTAISNNEPEPEIQLDYSVEPENPVIGEQVTFDATDTTHSDGEPLVFFWTSPGYDDFYNEGPTHQAVFEETGNFVREVWITHARNTIESDRSRFEEVPNLENSVYVSIRESISVEVSELAGEEIDLTTPDLNVNLTGNQQSVPVDERASLSFSVSNLIGGGKGSVTVQLVLQVPQGLFVNDDTFESTAGQFTSTYELEPGDTTDDRITIETTEAGEYQLTGHVVYNFEDGERDITEETEIIVRFYE